jgi:Tol biopolymer transport system component
MLQPGTRLSHYEVGDSIGAGGMGEVYRARDTKLNRDVALKVLPEAFVTEPERLARFQREAEVLAALNHPNIAHIYGLEDSGDTPAIVLELVEGPTLADRIAQGAIPLDEALNIANQIADALEAAHALGIIHRDLKPANIKIKPDGVVKVLDFGLAKAFAPVEGADSQLSQSPTLTKGTALGVILGTAAYMSPEQAKGKPVDTRTDVWAFGAVLYEMLAGKRAFQGEDVSDTLVSVFRDDPDWKALPQDLPPRILQAMRVCLQKEAKRRVRDIAAVRLAMEGAFETKALVPERSTPVRTGRRTVTLALVGLALFLAGGLGVWTLSPSTERPMGRFAVSTSGAGQFAPQADNQGLAISPDGTRIVYPAGPARQLYVRPIDTIEGLMGLGGLTGSDTPFFSPDGSWVGFATFSDTSWKKVSILGGPPVTLWDSPTAPRGASWGPDGTIIFAQREPGTGLYRGPAGGGEPEVLTTPDETAGELNHWWPEFLPGGEAVLFTIVKGDSDQQREIAVLDLNTKEYRVLIPGGSNPHYASTGHIVYGSENTLRAVPFDLDRLEVTGDPVPVVEDVMMRPGSGAVQFGLSSTGSLVYAAGSGGAFRKRALVWVDREGNEERVAAEPRDYQEFTLSPEGTRVALRVNDQAGQEVWVYDLTRNTATRLTFDSATEIFPTWTPDGTRIAFGSTVAPLAWKAADGTGGLEALGEQAGQYPQAFTPDGKTVVFEQREGGNDIGMLSLDGDRASTILLDSEFRERNAALSRDGRWLAYQSDESGRFEIYVRPFSDVNSGRWQISTEGGQWPLWSPKGDELFYRGPSGVMAQTFRTDPTFTPLALTQLFEWNFVGATNRRMAVSPDGEKFLLFENVSTESGTDDQEPQIILVQNWFEELKRRAPTN